MNWANQPISLDQPLSEIGDLDFCDLIEDTNLLGPDEISDLHLLNEKLERLLRFLPAREARILRLRYGLEDGEARTLKQIGDIFGLSRERIRQMEQRSLHRLRRIATEYQLEQFVFTS
jgi:RNA polymerase primary sigma factor